MIHPQSRKENHYGSQRSLDPRVHRWHQTILGYPDHLVSFLLANLGIERSSLVLDPFCGSGTTAVECKKRGIECVGVDANPASCFIAAAKTNWQINPMDFLHLAAASLVEAKKPARRRGASQDKTARYLIESGMVKRGWIDSDKLVDVVALKQAIVMTTKETVPRDLLLLALASVLVRDASNVKFGPEVYCSPGKERIDVDKAFDDATREIASDLIEVDSLRLNPTEIIGGDSRNLSKVMEGKTNLFDAVITSPPYPAEHDYTRNLRLELALFEYVVGRESLRHVKQQLLRSHSKGLYKSDIDGDLVGDCPMVVELRDRISKAVAGKLDGFSRSYPRVCMEYFGGMRRHFRSLKPILKRGSKCAYVVGDQASYMRVQIGTAEILAELARLEGFTICEIREWRERRATATRASQKENILIFQHP